MVKMLEEPQGFLQHGFLHIQHQLSCQGSSGLCIFLEGCDIRGGFHSEVWLV